MPKRIIEQLYNATLKTTLKLPASQLIGTHLEQQFHKAAKKEISPP